MKLIYTAGPYNDKRGEHYVLENIMRARQAALFIWRNGGVAICPHLNTYFFDGAFGLHRDTWIKGDLEIIKRCDGIYMVENWENSEGSKQELDFATEHGLKAMFTYEQVIEFLTDGGVK
jgi:hypothetical protein